MHPYPTPEDEARIAAATAAQERMLAALPGFPRFGFYVKTGLAGYGPDLEPEDMPATSWEDVALQVAGELSHMAEFNDQGASALADQAREAYEPAMASPETVSAKAWADIAYTYHEAGEARQLADDLDNLRGTFEVLAESADPAPLYQGRDDLRHARIWDLIGEHFPLDVSHNTRLYVWECDEDPGEAPEDYGPAPDELVTCPFGCTVPSLIPGHDPNPSPADPVYGSDQVPEGEFRCITCRRVFTPEVSG
jgi:hypothetical protein